MSLRELHKKLDQLEKRAITEKSGILPIVDCVDLDTIERWASYTPEERDRLRSDIDQRQADRVDVVTADRPGDAFSLAAIVVRDWLPDEGNLWRLDFEEIEPAKPKAEPIPTPEPTFAELHDAYEESIARRRAQR